MLNLQEIIIANSILNTCGSNNRSNIAYASSSLLGDSRFDERVANTIIDNMIKNGYIVKSIKGSSLTLTEDGYRELKDSVERIRSIIFKIIL